MPFRRLVHVHRNDNYNYEKHFHLLVKRCPCASLKTGTCHPAASPPATRSLRRTVDEHFIEVDEHLITFDDYWRQVSDYLKKKILRRNKSLTVRGRWKRCVKCIFNTFFLKNLTLTHLTKTKAETNLLTVRGRWERGVKKMLPP